MREEGPLGAPAFSITRRVGVGSSVARHDHPSPVARKSERGQKHDVAGSRRQVPLVAMAARAPARIQQLRDHGLAHALCTTSRTGRTSAGNWDANDRGNLGWSSNNPHCVTSTRSCAEVFAALGLSHPSIHRPTTPEPFRILFVSASRCALALIGIEKCHWGSHSLRHATSTRRRRRGRGPGR